ncbi:unnamed protein product [Polarella glacialis]|uniref:NADP-dependent oxidoreductase domain-containing protein n=1 Tax=Polarella glacialis TaxID=89957 RepID=A0A813JFN6_POLGL|nr:unnamed protein product [Polarella glacialis]
MVAFCYFHSPSLLHASAVVVGASLWLSNSSLRFGPSRRHRQQVDASAASGVWHRRVAASSAAAISTVVRARGRYNRSAVSMASLGRVAGAQGNRLPFLYGTAWKKEATTDLVVQAVREGFRGIDTACQPKHYREDLVGAAIARLAREGIPREELWLQTKFTPMRGQDPANVPYDPKAPLRIQVEQSIAQSVRNLGTDHIDSLVLHSPLPTLQETLEVWSVFERAVDNGTVGQLGISNCYDFETFKGLFEQSRVKPKVLQNRFYKDSGYDSQLRAFCLENGVTYQTFWTLSANPNVLKASPVVSAAHRLQVTAAPVLFRWLIQSGHQPLTGTKSREHMRQDLQAADLQLTSAEMSAIGELFCENEGSSGGPSGCSVQ